MALGDVERGEIVPVVLDLRPGRDREAEVGEDLGELVHHLADRVDAALRRAAPTGRVMSSPSVASRRSSAAASSAALRAAIASVTALAQAVDARPLAPAAPRASCRRASSAGRSPRPACRARRPAPPRARRGRPPPSIRPSQSGAQSCRMCVACHAARRSRVWPASSKPAAVGAVMDQAGSTWPELTEARDGPTIAALHLFSQILGKAPSLCCRGATMAGTSPSRSTRAG